MRVLVADDERLSLRILEDSLQSWGYEVVSSENGIDAWEKLKGEDAPNLVVLDWVMPGMDGLDICQRIRKRENSNYVYIILLTGKGEREDIIKGLESGADDYIIKPFNPEELKYRLKIGERIVELEQRIMSLAMTDHLTGLLNRRAFMERLEAEINRSRRCSGELGIIIIDLDHFKLVNDKYGHQAGDLVLQKISHSMCRTCRSYDFVGRYGGEEFIACLPGTNLELSIKIAERIRNSLEGSEIKLPDREKSIKVTASFGVACMEEGAIESIDSLIKKADKALYQAKNAGRNQVVFAKQ